MDSNRVKTQIVNVEKLQDLKESLNNLGALFICDENTYKYAKEITNNSKNIFVLKSGEDKKNTESVFSIIDFAISKGATRQTHFVAVGGGVVSDIVGFASSIYMRGAKLSIIPTTLLSAFDACYGGKTGVDYKNVKNLIGTFFQSEKIYICAETFKTLSESDFYSGLGEVLKHAILSRDEKLSKFLMLKKDEILNRDTASLSKLVELSLEVKKYYVEQDPFEDLSNGGIRRALNLGHTFAHAIESLSNMEIQHGIAVSKGLILALNASLKLNLANNKFVDFYKKLLQEYGVREYKKLNNAELEKFLFYIQKDKKKVNSGVKFVLPVGQGKIEFTTLENDFLRELLR